MNDSNVKTIEQIQELLEASNGIELQGACGEGKKNWIEEVLVRFNYLITPLIRFTKSRLRHSNDSRLVGTKNEAALRKHLGYAYIPQKSAERLNQFNRDSRIY